jgi:heptosyltransferase-3
VTTVAALLEGSWGFVGNDSGTSHLAAAVGAATVALFGPTDAAVWAPAGVRVKVVVAGNVPAEMERISVATVFAACQERFEAPPTA